MKYLVKVAISILLFGCLLHMPYSYYQLVRWSCCIGFIWLVYEEIKAEKIKYHFPVIGCVILAILFNPLKPFYYTKSAWQTIDVITGVLLIMWIILDIILTMMDRKRTINN
jgi:hypothetical protein